MDILKLFYDEMTTRSVTRDLVFLSIEEDAAAKLSQKMGRIIAPIQAKKLADICIANEWLERTTADPNYKYLSLTENGLQVLLAYLYR